MTIPVRLPTSKVAGSKGFSTYVYPTNIFYCIKGTTSNSGYLWPGTVIASGTYPDTTTPGARYRIQQPTILSGLSATCNSITGGDSVTITVCKDASGGTLLSNPTVFTVTLSAGTLSATFYNASVDFNVGQNINLHIAVSGSVTDLAVQLDLF